MNKRKGISLIVLVITILVMIILAGVVVVSLQKNNPIEKAKESKYTTDLSTFKQDLQLYFTNKITLDSTFEKENIIKNTYEQINECIPSFTKEYIGEVEIYKGELVSVSSDIKKIKWAEKVGIKHKNTYIEVGKYINYPVDTSKIYNRLNKITCGDATTNKENINAENLTWQVFNINTDGSIDIISSPSVNKVSFSGSLGYNNAVFLLNDLCDKLYSTKFGKARSINIEDLEKNFSKGAINERNLFESAGIKYGDSKTYNVNMKYPDIYAYEKGAGIGQITSQETGITVSQSYKNYENGITDKLTHIAPLPGLTARQTYYTLALTKANITDISELIKSESGKEYFLASRYAYIYPDEIHFGIRIVRDILTGARMITSSGSAVARNYSYRVVVRLNNDIKINIPNGENSVSNPYIIQ